VRSVCVPKHTCLSHYPTSMHAQSSPGGGDWCSSCKLRGQQAAPWTCFDVHVPVLIIVLVRSIAIVHFLVDAVTANPKGLEKASHHLFHHSIRSPSSWLFSALVCGPQCPGVCTSHLCLCVASVPQQEERVATSCIFWEEPWHQVCDGTHLPLCANSICMVLNLTLLSCRSTSASIWGLALCIDGAGRGEGRSFYGPWDFAAGLVFTALLR
jgi:hypothetical protein